MPFRLPYTSQSTEADVQKSKLTCKIHPWLSTKFIILWTFIPKFNIGSYPYFYTSERLLLNLRKASAE